MSIESGIDKATMTAQQIEALIAAWSPTAALVMKVGRLLVARLRRSGDHAEADDLEKDLAELDKQTAASRANLATYDALRAADRAAAGAPLPGTPE